MVITTNGGIMKLFETFIFQNLTEEEFEDMKSESFYAAASISKALICGETKAFFPMFRKDMPLQKPMRSVMSRCWWMPLPQKTVKSRS